MRMRGNSIASLKTTANDLFLANFGLIGFCLRGKRRRSLRTCISVTASSRL